MKTKRIPKNKRHPVVEPVRTVADSIPPLPKLKGEVIKILNLDCQVLENGRILCPMCPADSINKNSLAVHLNQAHGIRNPRKLKRHLAPNLNGNKMEHSAAPVNLPPAAILELIHIKKEAYNKACDDIASSIRELERR